MPQPTALKCPCCDAPLTAPEGRGQFFCQFCGTPVTIVFDGSGPKRGADETPSKPEVEILFTRGGQTADQAIERAAVRLLDYGEVLVVTDDYAERDTVVNLGGMASSCENFVSTVETALGQMQRELKHHNEKERTRFRLR